MDLGWQSDHRRRNPRRNEGRAPAWRVRPGRATRPGGPTRVAWGFDFASNTAYGLLLGHVDWEFNTGNGFDSQLEDYVNLAYVSWAGLTAGRALSFFSYLNGGVNWANIFSPDRLAYNQPDLIAYSAAFSGGLSASVSLESTLPLADGPGTNWQSNGFNTLNSGGLIYSGARWPDFVAQIHAKESWGEAQLSGALHDVDVRGFNGFAGSTGGAESVVGWAVLAGGKINFPSLGDGDDLQMQAVFSRNAIWYSGIPGEMVNENGQTNGNGQQQFLADAFFNGVSWGVPTAWSIEGYFEHHFTAEILHRSGSLGRRSQMEPHRRAHLAEHDEPHCRRRHWLGPGDEPQFRSGADVSDDGSGQARRLFRNQCLGCEQQRVRGAAEDPAKLLTTAKSRAGACQPPLRRRQARGFVRRIIRRSRRFRKAMVLNMITTTRGRTGLIILSQHDRVDGPDSQATAESPCRPHAPPPKSVRNRRSECTAALGTKLFRARCGGWPQWRNACRVGFPSPRASAASARVRDVPENTS